MVKAVDFLSGEDQVSSRLRWLVSVLNFLSEMYQISCFNSFCDVIEVNYISC